jgi:hypothetical protein
MKHPSTQSLFAYWDVQRGARLAPERSDIDPAAIRHVLGDTFVLAVDFVEEHRFRLAGTKVCAMFCRELKGEPFTQMWTEKSRVSIRNLLTIVADEAIGVVAGATGRAQDGERMELEMMLLPLARRGHARVRALGVLAPLSIPYWMGATPLVDLELGALRHVGPEVETTDAPRILPSLEGARFRHGFVVYDGGKEPQV